MLQSVQPVKKIVVNVSNNDDTKKLCQSRFDGLEINIIYHRAITIGAAAQHDLGYPRGYLIT